MLEPVPLQPNGYHRDAGFDCLTYNCTNRAAAGMQMKSKIVHVTDIPRSNARWRDFIRGDRKRGR